jgi:3'(2'), 5'-bisphosphate nucleotidase
MLRLMQARGGRLDARDRDEAGELFAALTFAAGPVVMAVYAGGCSFRTKADSSPVCDADERAESVILDGLSRSLPGWDVIAEEASSRGEAQRAGERFILVDPLDGTREFMSRNGEFTLNIGLIEGGAPVAGAVYAPALGRLWFSGSAAFACDPPVDGPAPLPSDARRIETRRAPADGLVALASRSHGDEKTESFLARLPVRERIGAGSSLKFCLLAEGKADVYPRFGPTMEWDTAAGDAILRAAGGIVETCEGGEFEYGKARQSFRNGGFVAWGDPDCPGRSQPAAIASSSL